MNTQSKPWRVLIVEDEFPAQEELERLLIKSGKPVKIVGRTESITSTVDWLEDPANDADLIFLDIHLADGQVFEVFRRTRIDVPVIFTTAYDEYAIRAFEVTSVDYLLKPIEEDALNGALDKFEKLQKRFTRGTDVSLSNEQIQALIDQKAAAYPKRLVVSCGDKFRRIEIDEVSYFFADDKYVFAVTGDGRRRLVDHTLEELGDLLDPKVFFRVNRRYLAQSQAIKDVERFFNRRLHIKLSPEPGDQVLVSRLKAKSFLSWLQG